MQTEILIYDGFDELDAIGPFEVLSPLAPRLVTLEPATSVTASHGLEVTPHGTLSQTPGLLVVPGGGWVARNEQAGTYAEYLRGAIPPRSPSATGAAPSSRVSARGRCCWPRPGSSTDGRRSPTTPRWTICAITAWTSGPVSAGSTPATSSLPAESTSGLDLALHLLERFRSAEVADAAARLLEHQRIDTAPVW